MNEQFETDVREFMGWQRQTTSRIEVHLARLNGQVAGTCADVVELKQASHNHSKQLANHGQRLSAVEVVCKLGGRDIEWLRDKFWLLIPAAGVLVGVGIFIGKLVL